LKRSEKLYFQGSHISSKYFSASSKNEKWFGRRLQTFFTWSTSLQILLQPLPKPKYDMLEV
jgi:hypothetical protein